MNEWMLSCRCSWLFLFHRFLYSFFNGFLILHLKHKWLKLCEVTQHKDNNNLNLQFHYTVFHLYSTYLVDIMSRRWPPLGKMAPRCCQRHTKAHWARGHWAVCLGGRTGRGHSWTRWPAVTGACWVVRYSRVHRRIQLVAHWGRRCTTS